MRVVAIVLVLLTTAGCGPGGDDAAPTAPFAPPAPPEDRNPPEARFVDVTEAVGITFHHESGFAGDKLLPETMVGGVGFLDFDNDGDEDILLTGGNRWPWDDAPQLDQTAALYRNDGGSFVDVAAEVGLATDAYLMGMAIADIDGNGFADVYLTALGLNQLFLNQGGVFVKTDAALGADGDARDWSTGAAFFDADGDRDLDLVVLQYVRWSRELDFEVDYRIAGIGRAFGPPTNFPGTQVRLYRNDAGEFTDVSEASGLWVHSEGGEAVGKGLALLIDDLNADGAPDIAVANDTTRNFAFLNDGGGRFAERGEALGLAFDVAGKATGAMGMDIARDETTLALAVGNFANEMTSFYVAELGSQLYADESMLSGIGAASRAALSFGLFYFDFDYDGWLDLLQVNGHVENDINAVQKSQQYRQSTQIFWRCPPPCIRDFYLLDELGALGKPLVGRGAAYGDYDGDGDLDVLVGQAGGPTRLFRNDTPTGNYLRVRLEGAPPNTHALGAEVELRAGARVQVRRVSTARSYLSAVERTLSFGLGEAQPDGLVVRWPDGKTERVTDVPLNQTLVVRRTVSSD